MFLTWFQARHLARVHRQRIRRMNWDRPIFFSPVLHLWLLEDPATTVAAERYRVVRASDMGQADFLARDWTNEPPSGGAPLRDAEDNVIYLSIPAFLSDLWGGVSNPTGASAGGFAFPGTPEAQATILGGVPKYSEPLGAPLILIPQVAESPGAPPPPPAPFSLSVAASNLQAQYGYGVNESGYSQRCLIYPYNDTHSDQYQFGFNVAAPYTGAEPGSAIIFSVTYKQYKSPSGGSTMTYNRTFYAGGSDGGLNFFTGYRFPRQPTDVISGSVSVYEHNPSGSPILHTANFSIGIPFCGSL